MMRQSLRELYGLQGSLWEQYAGVLEAHGRARLRPVAVGLPDAGVDADLARAAVDRGAAVRRHHRSPGCSATCSAAWPATTASNRALRIAGIAGDGLPPDPVLHRRLRAADRVRLPLAGAADQRRRADEPGARLQPRLRAQRAAAFGAAGAVAGAGGPGRLVHGHALAGVQHRQRGLRRLCRARRRRARAHPALLRDAQRAGAAGDGPGDVARRASSTAPSSPSRCSATPASARCWSTRCMPATTAWCSG